MGSAQREPVRWRWSGPAQDTVHTTRVARLKLGPNCPQLPAAAARPGTPQTPQRSPASVQWPSARAACLRVVPCSEGMGGPKA